MEAAISAPDFIMEAKPSAAIAAFFGLTSLTKPDAIRTTAPLKYNTGSAKSINASPPAHILSTNFFWLLHQPGVYFKNKSFCLSIESAIAAADLNTLAKPSAVTLAFLGSHTAVNASAMPTIVALKAKRGTDNASKARPPATINGIIIQVINDIAPNAPMTHDIPTMVAAM